MSPLAFFLVVVTPTLLLCWGMSAVALVVSARGTRPRYVFSSIERALRWPTIAGRVAYLVVDTKFGLWGDALFDMLGIAVTVWFMNYRSGDDDDYWKGKGRKLRRWLSSSTSSRTAFAGSAA